VLLAAAAVAVALLPMALAYLQLGYHDDVGATVGTDPAGQVESTLERALHDAADGIATEYRWERRSEAVTTVRERMESTVDAVGASRLEDGIAFGLSYNHTRAESWADRACPGGPDRQFGDCEADRGVVVQERGGRTHVLAAAFDIEMTTPETELRATTVIEIRPG